MQIETSTGLGSDVVFDGDGHIVTNAHVVGSAMSFIVTTLTGKQYKASLVGAFPADDLAVIKVSGAKLKPAVFADSLKLEVGDIAMAIGCRASSRRARRSIPATRAARSRTSRAA